jgi:hypothetical protein
MVRRSAPILLGLVVCLFAVYPSGATSALRLDESRIRVSLERAQTSVSLEVESGEPRTFGARVALTLVDPRDKVRAEAATDVSVRAGKNSFSVPLKLPYSELLKAERTEFPWYRLRYRVAPEGGALVGAVEKPVTVHPDGEERAATASAILSDAAALNFDVPTDAVRGSVRSELKVYPNLSAHLLEGVEAIMERPYGCGEQTISSSYPSVLALHYFEKDDGELDAAKLPPVGARALRYARLGYERLLRYRAPGGGFTYWGRGEPDLALTAYALRFLYDASDYIDVDEGVMADTRAWLVSRQREDGSWRVLR